MDSPISTRALREHLLRGYCYHALREHLFRGYCYHHTGGERRPPLHVIFRLRQGGYWTYSMFQDETYYIFVVDLAKEGNLCNHCQVIADDLIGRTVMARLRGEGRVNRAGTVELKLND